MHLSAYGCAGASALFVEKAVLSLWPSLCAWADPCLRVWGTVMSEVDGLRVRRERLASWGAFRGARKTWASGWKLKTSVLCALPEIRR